jgi:hypothetical protein
LTSVSACSREHGSDGAPTPGQPSAGSASEQPPSANHVLVTTPAPAAGQWVEIMPGGDTLCSRGSPYRFFVRGGRKDRVIVDFEGGGACWNQLTCSVSGSLFRDEARTLAEFQSSLAAGEFGGIYDPDPRRAFADWTLVHIPYCTGDIHWGNAAADYGDGLTIEHRGFVNASAALDWLYAHYQTPANIFVSGCSAGAYGAALHSAYIAQHYRQARVAMLADSGAGIITDSFLKDSLPRWNAQVALPPFIDALQRPLEELHLPDLYEAVSAAFPTQRFAQTATQYDNDQIFFYTAMGGKAADWPGLFRQSLARVENSSPNVRSYVPPGSMHCALPYAFFYTRDVNGVSLADWTEQLVLGNETPSSVACEGDGCCHDPVCDACQGKSEGPCKFCSNWPPTWSACNKGK